MYLISTRSLSSRLLITSGYLFSCDTLVFHLIWSSGDFSFNDTLGCLYFFGFIVYSGLQLIQPSNLALKSFDPTYSVFSTQFNLFQLSNILSS